MSQQPDITTRQDYPTGEAMHERVRRRHRSGTFWRTVFQVSTIIGIVALTTLLYNVLNQTFGLIALQNANDPEALVLAAQEERVLNATYVVTSEDDTVLAEGVAGNSNAIGFFGYAYYQENSNALRVVDVEGVTPTAATVGSGEYPLARPLFVYTSAELLRERPEVAAFIKYYLTHANEANDAVGYFPVDADALDQARRTLLAALGQAVGEGAILPAVDPASLTGPLVIAGSSTVFPLTSEIVDHFRQDGYTGVTQVDNIGTTAGFRRFCFEGESDVVNASRPISRVEREACAEAGRTPVEFRVGTDALAVVVNPQNDFLTDVALVELQAIFTTARSWSEVNALWPNAEINRFVPGADSGTLDYFVEAVFDVSLAELPKDTLVGILEANVSSGLVRRFEAEQAFAERSQENVYQLVLERVVEPEVVDTWSLRDSLFSRDEIVREVAEKHPDAALEFRSWLSPQFIRTPQASQPELAGVRTAIFGSLGTILITILFSVPIGVGAAIYLEEYAQDNVVNRIIRTNINNLAGVPSIIYGILGLAIFVRALEPFTSGAIFGAVDDPTTANGRTILAAGLTLGLLILPLIIINAQEAIRAVPLSLRQASYGLGATRWQTIWSHVLPTAMPGLLTGTILAMSRAVGETAPLVVIGASTFITVDPDGPFSKFTTLPIQIYQWTSRPQDEFRNIAAAAIVVLLVLLLSLNATAIVLRNRYSQRI